ncbi:biotin-dependent carboxyltransferase family protein [Brevibacillus sp. NRS-1366]|uniref:5-oxoprolinase subunit C family protein n=1 Tax=Brevibacillus sp. NRS-1366 TaxID=3233899 RepID=UPI003D1AF1DA
MIRIIEPGLETTVQDLGRNGHYHLGVPPSGAADKYSFIVGNLLLGNPMDYAGMEITLLGPEVEFRKNTVIAVTGAPVDVFLNREPIPIWENIRVQEGDVLSFSFSQNGTKAYLCVSGGIQVPTVLGSKSTFIPSHLGGYLGRKLQKGDEIPIGEPLPGVFKRIGKRVPAEFIPHFQRENYVRVVMGLSGHCISDDGVKSFLNTDWKVSTESNRVAYRFKGARVTFHDFDPPFGAGKSSSNVVDVVYPIGVIMVPNSEEIIVLLNDGTSGGGFVTIGTVISSDLDIIAQSRPNTVTRFMAVTVSQAISARTEKQERIKRLSDSIK